MAPCCVMSRTKGQTRPALEPAALVMETPVTWSSSGWTCEGRRVAPPNVPSNPTPPPPTHLYANRITNVRTYYSDICEGVGGVTTEVSDGVDTGHAWRYIRCTVVNLFLGLSWKRMSRGNARGFTGGICVALPTAIWKQHACSGNTNFDIFVTTVSLLTCTWHGCVIA